ncbi:TM2 domain-containing protein almondex-like isoform X1 [Stegodyphus dumicola]|uniref:TM2 domain-containing protein almondex-like isoform X1 n=1 Tax=Stegodyphus dumicola TaxID=202533 RepID=UPI0015AF2D25|nr:TM2 domain-containing protein almondex-like isoform X1 [Stegodyphus dumicola]XP_035224444.1 TM2 domain-containing protein almondex-like isoform X1 [Stegodyphus dumicola]
MLAQDVDNVENASAFVIDYAKLHSDSLIQYPTNVKTENNRTTVSSMSTENSLSDHCQVDSPCDSLSASCLKCAYNYSCIYGEDVSVMCEPKDGIRCQGDRVFTRVYNCRYCYQTPGYEHICQRNTSCHVVSAPRQRFIAKCSVKPHVLCLGKRTFAKHVPCNWTKGYNWGTALLLSIVFGGFGVDRFYLGMWQEGIGKLFSFGGLGVWTLVDVILIATGYLGPADHSLYIRT